VAVRGAAIRLALPGAARRGEASKSVFLGVRMQPSRRVRRTGERARHDAGCKRDAPIVRATSARSRKPQEKHHDGQKAKTLLAPSWAHGCGRGRHRRRRSARLRR
jgi:hypothetical protein